MPSPLFEVVIPTRNHREGLLATLAGLAAQTEQRFRVWVCVDGSTDGTLEAMATYAAPFPLQVLTHPGNQHRGRTRTRNLALPHLEAPYTLYLDSDIVPLPHMLAAHLQVLQQYDDRCFSLGIVHFTQKHKNAWADYLSTRGKARYPAMSAVPFQYLITDNVALPTACLLAIGGQADWLSPHYGADDTEMAWRLHRAYGYPSIHNTRAEATSDMAKKLSFVYGQMENYGRHNLRAVQQHHPDFTQNYRMDLLAGHTLKARLFRLLLARPLYWLVRPLMGLPIPPLRRLAIHYGVAHHLLRGYRQGESEQNPQSVK